jgi:hypothetical protein
MKILIHDRNKIPLHLARARPVDVCLYFILSAKLSAFLFLPSTCLEVRENDV